MQTSLPADVVRACELVARDHGLTAREAEILELLVEARGSRRIEEALYVSHNTVKTHMLHIHRKLDAHSREAVLELVEKARLEQVARSR